jgi:hypothetical protein
MASCFDLMSQIQTPAARSPRQWCDAMQAKLMAAIDEAWELAASSDDPAVQARARDKARLCGQMAATARKIAAMTPATKPGKGETGPEHPLDLIQDFVRRMDKATTAIEAAEEPAPEPQPRAAQAVAMQAALAKLKRR